MPTTPNNGHSVSFITMGCAKNEVDSDHMANRLLQAGYQIIDDPEIADAVVVNTCSFIQAATEESIDAVLEAAGYDNVSSGRAHLIVAGCMPSRYGDELESEFPEVSGFVPCANELSIVAIADKLFGIERLPGEALALSVTAEGPERPFSYVKISDGCDRFCAYCSIPFIRGRYHSFSYDEVKREVERTVALGAREVVLIAQDTGRWGADFEEPSSLARLVDSLAESFGETWFRVMYIQPEGVTDELLDVVAKHDNVCKYFDIPFQHCSADVLRAMNRKGSADEHLALIEKVREKIPDATLRTTLIAGFPGETDDEFEQLCEFVEDAQLDYVGVFPYSREEGTRAYDLPDQVDEDEKMQRTQALRDLADAVCMPRVASRIGKTFDVLVCGREEDGQLYGRAMCQAPDVDGVTYVDKGAIGDIVNVVVDDALVYEMEGSVLS